jgi:O-antigen ligase/Tfp pilus assembly protein PilF
MVFEPRATKIDQGIATFIPWFIFVILPFIYFVSENMAVISLQAVAGISAILLAAGAFSRLPQPSYGFSVANSLIAIVWLALISRATFFSGDFSTSFPVLIKAIGLLLLFFVVSRLAKNQTFIDNCDKALLLTAFIHGLLAIWEYIEAPPIPKTWVDPELLKHVRTRCAGIFTDPNIYGAFLAVLFILLSSAMLRTKSKGFRYAGTAGLLLSGFALLTTLSRGSWISLFAGMLFLSLFAVKQRPLNKDNLKALAAVILVLVIITLAGPFKYRLISITKSKDMTIAQRSLINKAIVKHFYSFPIVGHGLHTFNQVYPRYRMVGGDYPMNAHNEFIHSLLETGHLSALLLLLWLLFLLRLAWQCYKDAAIVSGGFAGAFVCLAVHNLSGFSSRILPTAAFIAFCAAAAAWQYKKSVYTAQLSKIWPRVFYISVTAVSVICLWQGAKVYKINQLMLDHQFYLQSGKIKPAIEALAQVEKLDPTNSLAFYKKAEILKQLGLTEEAKTALKHAISLNKNEALFYIKLARIVREKQPGQSENLYRKAIELDPASELFRLEFARFLAGAGKTREALEQLNIALDYSPGFHQVYTNYLQVEKLQERLRQSLNSGD